MLSTLTWPLWLVERTRLKTYKCINLPIFLSMICAKACKNSFVFWGSCPLTIFDGFAAKFSPNANDTQSKTFSRYRILPSLSEKIENLWNLCQIYILFYVNVNVIDLDYESQTFWIILLVVHRWQIGAWFFLIDSNLSSRNLEVCLMIYNLDNTNFDIHL